MFILIYFSLIVTEENLLIKPLSNLFLESTSTK